MPRFADVLGGRHNVGCFAWYGLEGGIHIWDGFVVYPKGRDPYGNDVVGAHCRDFAANVLISLIDVWVMRKTKENIGDTLWCPWLPIDHDPVPEAVLEALDGADFPLTYSQWGSKLLADAGVENTYIAHGVEPSQYSVLPPDFDRRDFQRQFFGVDEGVDPFVSIMVAANKGFPDRKAFGINLRAWAEFAKDKPHAVLYLHTDPTTSTGGVDLLKMCAALGIGDRVVFPDRYQYGIKGLPWQFMTRMYNSADVLIGSTMSEGFGIPIIESQACGVPVIVSNCSSMPELVRWGYAVDPIDKFWTPMNSYQWIPDVRGVKDALEAVHQDWVDGGGVSHDIQQRVEISATIHAEFSWDTLIREQWVPLLNKVGAVAVPRDCPQYIPKWNVVQTPSGAVGVPATEPPDDDDKGAS